MEVGARFLPARELKQCSLEVGDWEKFLYSSTFLQVGRPSFLSSFRNFSLVADQLVFWAKEKILKIILQSSSVIEQEG